MFPSHNISTDPMSFLGGTPVTGPRSLSVGKPQFQSPDRGEGVPDHGSPPPIWPGQDGVPLLSGQVRMGSPPKPFPLPNPSPPPPPPVFENEMEYLIRRGRYASCGFPQEDFLVLDVFSLPSFERYVLIFTGLFTM